MKKIFVCLLFVLGLSLQLYSQNTTNTVMASLSDNENMDKITVGSFMMFMTKLVGGVNNMPLVKGVKSMEVLTFNEKCSYEKKMEIKKQVTSMKDDDEYATLMQVKDKKDFVRIMMKKKESVISEILIVVLSEDINDAVVVKMKGKMKESDLADLVAKYEKKDGC